MKHFLLQPKKWLIERLGLEPAVKFLREHKVPPGLGGKKGWMYVFGAATLIAFVVQVVTGIALATVYVPSPDQAHATLLSLNATRFGSLVRAMHFYGASAMVVFVFIHMARTFLTASYKIPRQFNWITGVVLLVLTMTMAVTGQLLRWDENGMWTVVVAAKFIERVPFVGPWLAEFALGGPALTANSLTRFFSLHVLIIPAAIALFVGAHLYQLAYHGISEPPGEKAPVEPDRYRVWYHEHKEAGRMRYWPDNAWREAVVALVVIAGVLALALIFGPKGPGAAPDPTKLSADPRPDWFVRWYYALLWLKPGGLERWVMIYLPLAVIGWLIALPLLFGKGPRTPKQRPWAPALVVAVAVFIGILTYIGGRVPWSPDYESTPIAERVKTLPAGLREGANIFHARGCQYCHRVLGAGGEWGPDLTRVRQRISAEEITVRIVQGYRDMPPYAEVLAPGELEALVAFLVALPDHPRAEASE